MKSAGGNGTKMRNSPDIHFMGLAFFSSIFLFCIGLLMHISTDFWAAQSIGIFFFTAIALLLLVPITYLEVIRRPKEVHIGDPLVLIYRTREARRMPLEDIEWVDANQGDQSTLVGRMNTGGRVKVKGEAKALFFTYEITSSVVEKYQKKYGRWPSSRPENRGS